jgi:hypothetical protein
MKGYNPERNFLSASETRLSEAQEALYPLLVPQTEARAIQMDRFRDLYDVDKDLAYVSRMEAEFRKADEREGITENSRKGGKLFESIVDYGIDEGGFLGEDATAIVASRFDDVNGGIDTFVEFEDEGMTSHLALGIDVTRNPNDVKNKFDKIRSSIDNGQLSSGKYFKSGNFRGELRHILRVVVGADQPTVDNISDLIVRSMRLRKSIKANEEMKNSSESASQLPAELGKVMKALAEHPLQWILLLEIKNQLEASRKRAEKKQRPGVVEVCDNILAIINKVMEDKKDVGQSVDEEMLLNDRVYQLIQQEVKSF